MLKLKLKIYANIYDFIDEIIKMVRYASDHMGGGSMYIITT
jgi:hypothetical protein